MGYLFDPLAPVHPEGAFEGLGAAQVVSERCGPWPAKIPYSFDDLHPAFRPVLAQLLEEMDKAGLSQHFRIVTGKRSLDRQCRAICEGGSELSDPSRGAHTAGLAVDFHAKPGAVFRNAYDVGLDKDTHTEITNPAAYALWSALGSLIKSKFGSQLTWGGDWKNRYVAKAKTKLGPSYSKSKILIGFDPYHVELKGYTKYLPERGYWRCEGGRAVERSDTARAAVERAVEEEPGKAVGLPMMLIGAGAVYWLFIRKKGRR